MLKLKYPTISINNEGRRKSLTGRTLWCGPFAVAIALGVEYDDAHALILADIRRAIMKRRRERAGPNGRVSRAGLPTYVKGTYEHQIARLLNKRGVKTDLVYSKGGTRSWPTLLTFAREHTVKDHVYLIVAGHHWVTICNGILYHSHHDPIPVEDAPKYRMARVECWADVRVRPEAIAQEEAMEEAA